MEKEKSDKKMEYSPHFFEHFKLKIVYRIEAIQNILGRKTVLYFPRYFKQNYLERIETT